MKFTACILENGFGVTVNIGTQYRVLAVGLTPREAAELVQILQKRNPSSIGEAESVTELYARRN